MNLISQIDGFLWRKGFIRPPLRACARNMLIFSTALTGLGAALLPWTPHVFWAGAMSLLTFWNFYSLSVFIHHAMPATLPQEDMHGTATARLVKKGLLVRSNLRLFITGIFVYVSLVYLGAGPASLFIGLTLAMSVLPASLFLHR
ncbi:MAG: hypothetical protein MJ061_00075 [Mailhella sp.]|nr:hypothetical protein [Mailhella sp.]